jgi:5-methylcytosine-specific restriction enzyme subunit McrC
MIPFLVNMARLYELFVAEWLKLHLPAPWRANRQETVRLGPDDELQFDIDLVLYDDHEQARVVLDTKYKTPDGVDNPDFNQIVTYAKAKDCRAAVLVYPAPLVRPLDVWIGDLHVRSLVFALEGDLEEAGQQFLADLFAG